MDNATNPYATIIDVRGGYDDVIKTQTSLANAPITSKMDRAWWWYSSGVLHGAVARVRGSGWGSAGHAYTLASQYFAEEGESANAEDCRDIAASCFRLAATATPRW